MRHPLLFRFPLLLVLVASEAVPQNASVASTFVVESFR